MRARQRTVAKWLAVGATISMFVVLLSGVTVTDTGSGAGCGTSWPLCHGEFIPEFAWTTAIEYSHRAITSVATLLIVAASVGALLFWRQRTEIRILVPLMLLFLVLQAALGALAVLYPSWWGSNGILALHFGISLIAFATTLLTATLIHQIERGSDQLRDRTVPRGVALGAWALAAYTYGVVYLGAYVAHTDASLACLDWPLCQGSVFPGFTGPVGIVFSHRISALILTLGVIALAAWCWRQRATRPDLAWASVVAVVTLLLQLRPGRGDRLHSPQPLQRPCPQRDHHRLLRRAVYICLNVLPRPLAARTAETTSQPVNTPANLPIGSAQRADALTH
ncbi:MAG: COX15/CtaA family protein [Chloroflexia bacterium]